MGGFPGGVSHTGLPVAQVLGYRSWGSLWSTDTASRIYANVHRMIRVMLSMFRGEIEGWLTWHVRSRSGAKRCVQKRGVCLWSHKLLSTTALEWNRWWRRSEDTWIRRLMAWRSGAHRNFLKELSAAAGVIWLRRLMAWERACRARWLLLLRLLDFVVRCSRFPPQRFAKSLRRCTLLLPLCLVFQAWSRRGP